MEEFNLLHKPLFRRIFLEKGGGNLLLLINTVQGLEGKDCLCQVCSTTIDLVRPDNRYSFYMVTVEGINEDNAPSLIQIALEPPPDSEKYMIPLMLARVPEDLLGNRESSTLKSGISISSWYYRKLRRMGRKTPVYQTLREQNGSFTLNVLNLFKYNSPLPTGFLSAREQMMYFLHYAGMYGRMKSLDYSVPSFLTGGIPAPLFSDYMNAFRDDEHLPWAIWNFERGELEEATRTYEAEMAGKEDGEQAAREFLFKELTREGLAGECLEELFSCVKSREAKGACL